MDEKLNRALTSLEGLSVGDAFGEQFFTTEKQLAHYLDNEVAPESPWHFTDDTNMALSVVDVLRRFGHINANELAYSFAQRYDMRRGYGPSMHGLLRQIASGHRWEDVSSAQFGGQGSHGNGAAMRSAPIGAYFADDMSMVVEQAELAACITHAHPEGIAGAIAVAVAAAQAWQMKASARMPSAAEFLDAILVHVPRSEVSGKIRKARDMGEGASQGFAVSVLGNGTRLSAQDTVPFSLWCAAKALSDYAGALWSTVRGLGDRDTTCAIVGGIVAMYTGVEGIPSVWLESRESFSGWHVGAGGS